MIEKNSQKLRATEDSHPIEAFVKANRNRYPLNDWDEVASGKGSTSE